MQPFYIKHNVYNGFGRGSRELGCPTANLGHPDDQDFWKRLDVLTNGIYYGFAQLTIDSVDQIQFDNGKEQFYEQLVSKLKNGSKVVFPILPMVCSLGYNPHYNNKQRTLEVHILREFQFNFYKSRLAVAICGRIRDECSYNSLEDLKDAIKADINFAKNALDRAGWSEVKASDHFLVSNIPDHYYQIETLTSNNNNNSI